MFFSSLNFQTYAEDASDDEQVYISRVKSAMGGSDSSDPVSAAGTAPQVGLFPYVRMIITLLFVLGLIYLIYYILKKRLNYTGENEGESAVLFSQGIGTAKSVKVVHIGGKYLIIGVTNDNISYLSEITDEKEIERLEVLYNDKKVKSGDSFIDTFQSLIKRIGGKVPEKMNFDYEEDSVEFLKKQNQRIKNIRDNDI